ncbi:DNA-directed DNA polymerase II small subunit [Candidatus Thorarchaeota archaeon]|nr:MAG: DNA-directed DNA polymerase II small subunit [Candidatus Thorarchaeota archaeon]
MKSSDRREVLRRLLDAGLQVTPDALDYVLTHTSSSGMIDEIVRRRDAFEDVPVVGTEDFVRFFERNGELDSATDTIEANQSTERFQALSEHERAKWNYEIVKCLTPDSSGSSGDVEDFLMLFRDRYHAIERIFRSRLDTRGAISPSKAKEAKFFASRNRALSRKGERTQRAPIQMVLGIVRNKRVSRSRNVVIELEDESDSITCVIPSGRRRSGGEELVERGNALLLDEIICVAGKVDSEGRLIAEDVLFPDVSTARNIRRAKRNVNAVFISDIHCGSNEFLEDDFDRFVKWLRGIDGDSSKREMVENVRYLFIAGDLSDGVGVYPAQKANLLIDDVIEQYAYLAQKLRDIPKRIKIFCIPGNHDACRQALPRPPIPEEFAPALYDMGDRITMLGDPSQLLVEGVSILVTHGDSLDDLVTQIPGASYKRPEVSMRELLKKRHLAPLYGGKTELAPLHKDWMVIDTPPDIVHFGHAHHNAVDSYRGVQIINSGTFQGQTDFMRKQGVEPTPGIVTIVNLKTLEPKIEVFHPY